MKFKINRDHFSNGLQQVLNVVGSKASMPILSNVLIEAVGETLSVTTTNLDLGICARIKASVEDEGAITLPVKRLATIVKELPNSDVSVEASPNNQVKIASGGSLFKIMGISRDEFPALPEFADDRSFTIEQSTLAGMLRSVSYAQSSDETRYMLNGVYFKFSEPEDADGSGKLSLVATDGRRLAKIDHDMEVGEGLSGSLILPAKTVSELTRLLDKGETLKIAFNDRRVSFQIHTKDEADGFVGDILLVSKVVEGNYPNYQQVIPKETHQRIKVERELFLQSIHRAALVATDKSNSVKIQISNNLMELSASSPDFGESHESLAIDYSGPDLQVAFNPAFLMDPLRALTKDEIFFELKDEVSPGVFKTLESFLCVIMPVRYT
ncbi:MAG: DNA polymerase III subunit beta [Opitutaceae bacterium]|nr:DNA polymerase III subunit beta [Opitutaceae bacterium]